MELAACLRGSEPLALPPVTNLTTDEFLALLNQDILENPPPDPNHYEIALDLLGLVAPGALRPEARIMADVERFWGIYRNAEKDILIIDHGVAADEPEPNLVLLHEFVHALQDADVDLGGYVTEYSTSDDSNLAARSVVEGEARFHETRYWSSILGLDPVRIDWTEHFQNVVELAEEAALSSESPYLTGRAYFPYEHGARFVNHAWSDLGQVGIDALFASPPTRSLALMTSVSAIEPADWPEPEFPALEPPEPFTLWAETSLGAWGLFLQLARPSGREVAHDVAVTLRGDRLGIFFGESTRIETTVVWQLEFAADIDAQQMESLVRNRTGVSFLREGNRFVMALSTSPLALDWALVP